MECAFFLPCEALLFHSSFRKVAHEPRKNLDQVIVLFLSNLISVVGPMGSVSVRFKSELEK